MDLKPYKRRYPELIAAAGALTAKARGAYWIRYTLTDHRGVVRQFRRPFLAIDRKPDDSPLLIGMPGLKHMGVSISLGEQETWQYQLQRPGKTAVKVEGRKRFNRRLRTQPKVYILMPHNHLIRSWERTKIDGLPEELLEYTDVFAASGGTALAPHRDGVDLAIEVEDGKQPPYGPLYPLSPAELEVLRQYLQENLEKGFIRPSKSPAGAPILFVPKKDGGLRLCVDYRGLNAVTVKNRYPLPLIGEIMDRVNGAKWFSKIDLKDAYHKIRIQPGDEWKTAFRTRYGHFEYMVMPFGLTNAPATFQGYINQALRGLVDDFCIVYLDDILIFSKTREEHTQHLQHVCQRLREHELYGKPSKCDFYQKEMEFLGFIINAEGVQMDPRRVQTISEWKDHPPKSYYDVQVFLGFCNFYRRFIRSYATLSRPITRLLKGSRQGKKTGNFALEWKEEQQEAFLAMLNAFTKAPILRHYDPQRPSKIETDASNVALGAIYSQKFEDDQWHPVAFYSRQFKGAEVHYGTPDKEMFAIVEAFKHWRHYLEGSAHPIEVWTDHQNLQAFMRQPRLNGRQARWCFMLTPYDFTIRYRKGTSNPADAPSRRPDYGEDTSRSVEVAQGLLASLETKIARVQLIQKARNQPAGLEALLRGEASSAEVRVASVGHPVVRPRTKPGRRLGPSPEGHRILQPRSETYGMPGPGVRGETEEADHLLRVIKVQSITRKRSKEATREEVPTELQISTSLENLIKVAQEEDGYAQHVMRELMEQKSPPSYSRSEDGLLLYKRRLYVPNQRSLIGELLTLYHDDPHAGHWGVDKTLELLKRKFFWKNMRVDVEDYVRTCPVCQGNAIGTHKPYGRLTPLRTTYAITVAFKALERHLSGLDHRTSPM